ncbi:MAG: SusF/SusE family outer membrane protein [Muribaculaceae bacterium]|nr:SusF/SusE family outer membrane protein [Muribaculaceae bacterium]
MKKIISLLTVFFCSLPVFAGMSNSIEYTQLNIVGTAVKGGWDLNATPMSKIDHGVFTWIGTLKAGEPFKFMNTTNGWNKHVVATTRDELIKVGEIHHLDFHANGQLPDMYDNKFNVDATGEYVVTVDLRSMIVCLTKPVAAPTYPDKYYITGSALDGNVVEMNRLEDFEFKQSLTCKPGNIILMDTPEKGDDTRYFIPMFEDVDLTFGRGMVSKLGVTTDADARGWSVSVPGDYIVYVSCSDNKYMGRKHVQRKYLYIVGGCCERSWDYSDDSICGFLPNPENRDELIWEGELRIGWDGNTEPDRFKILTEKSWTDENYHPYIADTLAEGTLPIRTTDGADSKWKITKDGHYKITVNTRNETMTVEYLSTQAPASSDGNGDGLAGVDSAAIDGIELSSDNHRVELINSPEPVDVKVVNLAGSVIAHKEGILKGVVADNLSTGIYVVSVTGMSVNKSYKVRI